MISSVIVIEILKCLVVTLSLKLPERLGRKGLHFLHLQLYLSNFPMLQEPKSLVMLLVFLSVNFIAIVFSFYYSLIVTDYKKKFVVPCGIHILSTFLSKTSVTWLLAIRVELNALTLPVVPFSLVQLNLFKGCNNYSFRWKRDRRIAILWVERSLSHWSVMLQSQVLYVCSPLSMKQAVELNFQSSDILLTLWVHGLTILYLPRRADQR